MKDRKQEQQAFWKRNLNLLQRGRFHNANLGKGNKKREREGEFERRRKQRKENRELTSSENIGEGGTRSERNNEKKEGDKRKQWAKENNGTKQAKSAPTKLKSSSKHPRKEKKKKREWAHLTLLTHTPHSSCNNGSPFNHYAPRSRDVRGAFPGKPSHARLGGLSTKEGQSEEHYRAPEC